MGTENRTRLYCSACGNGNFIVRGFGSLPFQMNGGRGEAKAAVHKAAGPGEPVTQEVAASVRGDEVDCSINGTVVASYDKAALIAEGKLKSADDSYGIRFAYNTDVPFSCLTVSKYVPRLEIIHSPPSVCSVVSRRSVHPFQAVLEARRNSSACRVSEVGSCGNQG